MRTLVPTMAVWAGVVVGCGAGQGASWEPPPDGEAAAAGWSPPAPHVLPTLAVAPRTELLSGVPVTLPEGAGEFSGGRPGGLAGVDAGAAGNGIAYHGGPLLTATKTVYFIWYGKWSGNTATTILPYLVQHLGASPYFNINSTYKNASSVGVSNAVAFVASTSDNYSQGTSLGDAQVAAVVSSAVSSRRLPVDANGVYFVFTSADVNETSGFCTRYCGWHTAGYFAGSILKYAFVGNADRCPGACAAQATGPNGNAGADAMASVLTHELEEAATDPLLNAWYDTGGNENADKCAWTFGTTSVMSTGAKYNVSLGGKPYLIQQNWVNAAGGYCALHYP